MAFQHFNLFPHMTALQNVAEALIREVCSRAEARRRGVELLTASGSSASMHSFRATIGGEQQRGHRAGVGDGTATWALLDEPTSALDPELVGEVGPS